MKKHIVLLILLISSGLSLDAAAVAPVSQSLSNRDRRRSNTAIQKVRFTETMHSLSTRENVQQGSKKSLLARCFTCFCKQKTPNGILKLSSVNRIQIQPSVISLDKQDGEIISDVERGLLKSRQLSKSDATLTPSSNDALEYQELHYMREGLQLSLDPDWRTKM